MKSHLRVIGDIHGAIGVYYKLIKPVKYSIQLGDMGWGQDSAIFFNALAAVDADHHRIVAGNHDDYGVIKIAERVRKHFLGDYGTHSIPLRGGRTFDFFFIRGAYSIDRASRLVGISWWPEEELKWDQGWDCVQAYREAQPRTVFTHDCPEEVCYLLGIHARTDHGGFRPTTTHRILQSCWEIHRPETWVFAHHHLRFRSEYKGTTFMCLDGEIPSKGDRLGNIFREQHLVSYIDFDEDGHLLTPFPASRPES